MRVFDLSEFNPDVEAYRQEIESSLIAELRMSRQFHDVFHLWPALFLGVERRTSILWRAMARLLRGEQTYGTVSEKLGPFWPILEFLSDLVRVAPPLRRLSGLRDPAPPERFFRRGTQHPTP